MRFNVNLKTTSGAPATGKSVELFEYQATTPFYGTKIGDFTEVASTGEYYIDVAVSQRCSILVDSTLKEAFKGVFVVGNDEFVPDGSVDTVKLANDAVTSAKIANGAVGANEIATGAVGTTEIAADAVTQANIAANAVGFTELANGAVAADKIQDGGVLAGKLNLGAVTSGDIANGVVDSDALATDAVTTVKIAAEAVTQPKIHPDVQIGSGSGFDNQLLNNSVNSDLTEATYDITSFGYTAAPDVFIVHLSDWLVYVKTVTNTSVVIGLADAGNADTADFNLFFSSND